MESATVESTDMPDHNDTPTSSTLPEPGSNTNETENPGEDAVTTTTPTTDPSMNAAAAIMASNTQTRSTSSAMKNVVKNPDDDGKLKTSSVKHSTRPNRSSAEDHTPASEDARCCLDVFPLWCCTIQ